MLLGKFFIIYHPLGGVMRALGSGLYTYDSWITITVYSPGYKIEKNTVIYLNTELSV